MKGNRIDMRSCIEPYREGTRINLYIQPGASTTEVAGLHDGRLRIKIKAPAREGKANQGLIELLAQILQISKSQVLLLSGESSRRKSVFVELIPEDVSLRLQL